MSYPISEILYFTTVVALMPLCSLERALLAYGFFSVCYNIYYYASYCNLHIQNLTCKVTYDSVGEQIDAIRETIDNTKNQCKNSDELIPAMLTFCQLLDNTKVTGFDHSLVVDTLNRSDRSLHRRLEKVKIRCNELEDTLEKYDSFFMILKTQYIKMLRSVKEDASSLQKTINLCVKDVAKLIERLTVHSKYDVHNEILNDNFIPFSSDDSYCSHDRYTKITQDLHDVISDNEQSLLNQNNINKLQNCTSQNKTYDTFKNIENVEHFDIKELNIESDYILGEKIIGAVDRFINQDLSE